MRTHHSKLKTTFFSCGFFGHCTQTVLSPTTSQPPSLPLTPSDLPPPPPPPLLPLSPPSPLPPPRSTLSDGDPHLHARPDSESSSSSASHSFTQWRFPLPSSPLFPSPSKSDATHDPPPPPRPPPLVLPVSSKKLEELFHASELQLSTGSELDQLAALQLLERSIVPNPPSEPECPPELMRGLLRNLKRKAGSKPATKILLALCLAEANRLVAVEAGAVTAVIESVMELEAAAAERALAALELMCTALEGAEEVRSHALAVPVMVAMMGMMGARGREYAISILAVIYGSGVSEDVEKVATAPPEEVARAVALALQGDCSARGRRKGAQLLKALQDR